MQIKKETQDFPVNEDLGFIHIKLLHHPLQHDDSEMQKPATSEINPLIHLCPWHSLCLGGRSFWCVDISYHLFSTLPLCHKWIALTSAFLAFQIERRHPLGSAWCVCVACSRAAPGEALLKVIPWNDSTRVHREPKGVALAFTHSERG